MNYCVCFLFTPNFKKVLLQKKSRTDFKGMLNGVGGKQRKNEYPYECAIREIKEETGVDIEPVPSIPNSYLHVLNHIATTRLHVDCATHDDSDCVLDFWMSLVHEDEPIQQPGEDEPLEWVDVEEVLSTPVKNSRFAGDGDIQYMINLALRMYAR